MAAIARPKLRENGGRPMSQKLSPAAPSVAAGKVPAPVKVRLKRVNCVRSCFPTAANCSGSAAEQRDLRNRCERQLGVHRGRQAPR